MELKSIDHVNINQREAQQNKMVPVVFLVVLGLLFLLALRAPYLPVTLLSSVLGVVVSGFFCVRAQRSTANSKVLQIIASILFLLVFAALTALAITVMVMGPEALQEWIRQWNQGKEVQ